MKRVFIAIDISPEARTKVAEYIDALRRSGREVRVGWERPEKLHLTLKFLGDVNDNQLEEVQHSVSKVARANEAFGIAIGGTGTFPPKGEPRILWLGAQDEGQSGTIAKQIERELMPLGFEAEKRKFSPHLTIARLREPRKSTLLATKHVESAFEPVGFEVREIVIYESKLLPTGSVYAQIAAFPLEAAR